MTDRNADYLIIGGGIAGPTGLWFGGTVYRSHHTLDNIVDIRKVAHHLSTVEYRNWCALDNSFGKFEERHVWPAPGPVYRKETQAGSLQLVEMRITMRHQLIGFLGGRVQ